MDQQGLGSRAIIGMFYEILEQSKDLAWAFRVGMEINSDQESETYKWLGFSPAMREWLGGRNAKGLRENGITITNKEFEATLEIAKKDLRRDKTGQIRIRIGEMADRANSHWASLVTSLIIANGTCYDSKSFFASDHSEGDSGTLSNLLTGSDYSEISDVTTAANPTAVEMAKVILKLIQHLYSLKDDQGEPMNENARKFMIMVPTNMWAAGQQAVSSNLLSTGTGAIDNPIKNLDGFSVEVVSNPRLTSTTEMYAFRTDGRAKPFILQNEVPVEVSAIAEGSEEEFKNNRHLYGLYASRNVGFGYWQHGVKATLS